MSPELADALLSAMHRGQEYWERKRREEYIARQPKRDREQAERLFRAAGRPLPAWVKAVAE